MKKKKLKRLLKDALRQLSAVPTAADAGPTLSDWLVTYRKAVAERGYKVQTVRNRTAALKHVEAMWGAMPLRSIRPVDIATRLKLFTPHTARRVLGELRDVFVEAINNGSAETNPAAHVKPPKSEGLRKRLKLDTLQAMLDLSRTGPQRWVYAMLLLGLHTGQRRADLAKMRFDDVVDGCLRVEQQKKAGKPVGARLAIPLTLRLQATGMTLGDVIEHCKTIGAPGETLLRQANGRPIEMSSLSARFHKLIKAACGPDAYRKYEWPSLHEVRSLSARTHESEGMPAPTVQTLLGHKNEDMTEVYLDDRGLTAKDWKRVDVQQHGPAANDAQRAEAA